MMFFYDCFFFGLNRFKGNQGALAFIFYWGSRHKILFWLYHKNVGTHACHAKVSESCREKYNPSSGKALD